MQELEYEVEHELNWGKYNLINSPTPEIMTERFIEAYKEMNEVEFRSFIQNLLNSPF